MKKSIHFIPSSLVCSVAIDLTVEDGVIREVCFEGGCSGNLQGISMLVRGMKVEEVIERLEGIQCGSKRTSCPDQLVKALKEIERRNRFTRKESFRVNLFYRLSTNLLPHEIDIRNCKSQYCQSDQYHQMRPDQQ